MTGTELELLGDDIVVRVIPLDEAAVTLGRDLSNRVVLVDENVSAHHAVVQQGADGPSVRDLGSTNGTFVNDTQVQGRATLLDGDLLRLGPDVRLRVRRDDVMASGYLVIRDLEAGTIHIIEGDRFRIGSAADCHVRLAQGAPHEATLLVHSDGEIWLGASEADKPLAVGESFHVAGSAFRVEMVPENSMLAPTARPMLTSRHPYELTVTLDGAAGGWAELTDPKTGQTCPFNSEQRVSLLYLLAQKLEADRLARVIPSLAGWCHDSDLMIGVWGREGLTGATSRYSVLLHRVRKDIEGSGLDPWCLEKRRGATRLQAGVLHIS